MKKSTILSFLMITFLASCNAHWYEINTNGRVISFSKIAKEGKISVFILSTNWCSPCKALKNRLQDTHFDLDKIDFYYVNMSGNMKYDQLKRTNGYQIWRKIEQINAWPTIYIAAQTTNIVSSFSAEDEPYPYDKIVKITNDLIEDGKSFDQNTMFKGKIRQIPEKHEQEPEDNSEQLAIINPQEKFPNENPKNDKYSRENQGVVAQMGTKYRFRIATVSTKPSQKKLQQLEKYGKPVVVVKKSKWIIYLNDIEFDNLEPVRSELEALGYKGAVSEQQ